MKKIIATLFLFSLMFFGFGCTKTTVTPEVQPEVEHITVAENGDKIYQNDVLGIRFTYPQELGDLTLSLDETSVSGEFTDLLSQGSEFMIAGITKDYSSPRSSYYMDFRNFNYDPNNDDYFWSSVGIDLEKIEPVKVVNRRVLLIDSSSFVDAQPGPGIALPEGYSAGLINLFNDYSGLIMVTDGKVITQEGLLEILESLEFIEQ